MPRTLQPALIVTLIAATAAAGASDWRPLPGPTGGTVKSIATSAGTSYAAVATQGVYRRAAGDAEWSRAAIGLPPAARLIDLAATGDLVLAAQDTGVVHHSTDAGQSWSAVDAIAPSGFTSVHALGSTLIVLQQHFGGVPSEAFASHDAGASWLPLTLPATTGVTMQVLGDRLFMVSSGLIYRSDDAGGSWTQVNDGLPPDVYSLVGGDGQTVVVRSGFGLQTWRSDNAGADWTPATTQIDGGPTGGLANATSGSTIMRLRHAGTNTEVLVSHDGGDTWSQVAASGLPMSTTALNDLAASGETFLAAFADGIWATSDDGLTWTEHHAGITAHSVSVIASFGPSDATVFAGVMWKSDFRSTDGGATWAQPGGLPMVTNTVLDLSAATVLAGVEDGGVFRSIDAGQTWAATWGIPSYGSTSGLRVQPVNDISRSPGGTLFAATGGGPHFVAGDPHCGCASTPSGAGVFRSTNGGRTWQSASSGLPLNFVYLGEPILRPIEAVLATAGGVIAVTSQHGAYRSTNNGSSWSAVAGPGGGADMVMHDGVVFLTSGATLWRSADDGASWQQSGTSLPIEDASLASSSDGLLVFSGLSGFQFGAQLGIHRSTDDGVTWEPHGSGLEDLPVLAIEVDEDRLLAGVADHGVLELAPDPADIDGDGTVGVDDLLEVLLAWGACAGCPADVNGDGEVNVDDLVLVLLAWD